MVHHQTTRSLNMKVFIVLALIAVSSAMKVRIEKVGHEFSDCGGSKLTLNSLNITPDPVPLPGQITAAVDGEIKAETSMDIPCVDGLGSCTYDFCKEILVEGSMVCDFLPPEIPCACPLPATLLQMDNIVIDLPDMDWTVDLILNGGFEATIKLYSAAAGPDVMEGCIFGKFNLHPTLEE